MRNIENLETRIRVEVKLPDTKICKKCNTEYPLNNFKRNKECKFGFASVCKPCEKIRLDAWVKNNPDRRKQIQSKYRKNNPEAVIMSNKNYVVNNKDKVSAYSKHWKKSNPAKVGAYSRKRRTRSDRAYVSWANSKSIDAIYAMSKFLTAVVGVQYHVDHIIPLQGKKVSGLHVENNLAIVFAKDNLSKGNKYD